MPTETETPVQDQRSGERIENPDGTADGNPAVEDDKPLGPAGERALQAVRDENKQLRGDLNSFKQALSQALGIDPGNAKTDALATIQQEVATLRRENQVQRVARTHGIIDEADIALLMRADEGLVSQLAERLRPSANGAPVASTAPQGTPRPDPATGKGNGGRRPSSVAQAREDYLASRAKKTN